MFANTYGTQIEAWKVRLITRRARRAGFAGDELQDVQQEISLDVLGFQFDPSRSNGATEATVLTALIDRRLSALRRSKRRYEARFEQPADDEPLPEVEEPKHEPALAIDVRRALEMLSPEDRLVCEALADGKSVHQISQARGCGWHTVQRQVARIRQRFEAWGLDSWVKEGA